MQDYRRINQRSERNKKERHEGIPQGNQLGVSIMKLRQATDGYASEKRSKRDGESDCLCQRSRPEANGDRNQQEKFRVTGCF